MYHQSAFLAAGVPVFEIRQAAGMTNMLVETAALGRALAKSLADKPAVLMRGHGAVVTADSIPNVVGRSIYLDLNARIQAAGDRARREDHLHRSRRGEEVRRVRQLQPGVGAVEAQGRQISAVREAPAVNSR